MASEFWERKKRKATATRILGPGKLGLSNAAPVQPISEKMKRPEWDSGLCREFLGELN